MSVQIIITPQGEELAVLPRAEYEALLAAARRAGAAADEDAGTAHIVARSNAAIAAGGDVELPAEVAEAIARGDNAIRVLRKWRGLTQDQLARSAGTRQNIIAEMEAGRRPGRPALLGISRALGVPMELLAE
jgi:DNA-binding XRE family transcriptional regulator